MTTVEINSFQNRKYKLWRRWAAHPEAEDCPWIPMTGRKQIIELAQYSTIELLLHTDSTPVKELSGLQQAVKDTVFLPNRLMNKLVPVESHQSMLAFFKKPSWEWSDLTRFILVLDRIQDPGNLGTILRTAAATGIFSIITTPGTVSIFNQKALRASTGLLFRTPFLTQVPVKEIINRGYHLYAADAGKGVRAFDMDFESPLVLILGSEGQGLDLKEDWASAQLVRIPMTDETNSLNVGVSGSILMYEVFRRHEHV